MHKRYCGIDDKGDVFRTFQHHYIAALMRNRFGANAPLADLVQIDVDDLVSIAIDDSGFAVLGDSGGILSVKVYMPV